jgi:hypothetical protein
MSELRGSKRLARGAVAGFLGLGLLSGCAEAVQSDAREIPAATVLPGDIQLCYPLAPKAAIERDLYNDPDTDASKLKPIQITQEPHLTAMEYPGPLPAKIAKRVSGAVVRVDSAGAMGSGFLTNNRVAITAAHVIISDGKTNLSGIKVTDTKGRESNVVDACYALGSSGRSGTPEETEHVDVAILRLAEPLGTTTLKLAAQPPKRGEPVGFYNFQQDRQTTDPANYSGIALDLRSPYASNTALTGLGPEDDEKLDHTVADGASGGVGVAFGTGDVYGITTSEVPVYYGVMDSGLNVQYEPPHPKKEVLSGIAGMTDAIDIRHALAGGNY